MISLLFFAAVATAAPAAQSGMSPSFAMPVHFKYGNYPKITTNIKYGTPSQAAIETIVDTGSMGYWVYGPNSTINDGSSYLLTEGPCNKTVTSFYNYPKSKSRKNRKQVDLAYSYGGNGKIITGGYVINDTTSFPNSKWTPFTNQQVGIANFTIVRELDENCAIEESNFDHSILGLYPPVTGSVGIKPAFRANLVAQNPGLSSSFSMWFDKAPAAANGTFDGTLLLGAVPPASKYSGKLTKVNATKPDGSIGYYVSIPTISGASTKKPNAYKKVVVSDTSVTDCLVDSGTGTDSLPISADSFVNITGLVEYNGYVAYNGSCDSIPKAAALKYTFAGLNGGSVDVKVPLRNYARGQTFGDEVNDNICIFSMTLDNYGGCVLGAPFFSAAMITFNDSPFEIAMAQGGVSTGQKQGVNGLGNTVTIPSGKTIPGAV